MNGLRAIVSGLAGACALTLIHETARRFVPDAPRMDVLGMRALAGMLRGVNVEPPARDELHTATLIGDIAANSLYYSLVGANSGKKAWEIGSLLGLGAGLGAVVLPGPLGLGRKPSQRTGGTEAMTIAWYLAGGLAAAAAAHLLFSSENDD